MTKTSKKRKLPVITTKTASKRLGLSASVDKINYKFKSLIHESDLKQYLDSNGIEYSDCRLRTEHSIQVSNFYFTYLPNTKNLISKVITNPNKHGSFLNYLNDFEIVYRGLKDQLLPSRLDIAFDFSKISFDWLNRRLIVPRKSKQERYVLNGYEEQTRYFGKDPKTMIFYNQDDLEDEDRKGPRLESRIKGNSHLGVETLEDLVSLLTDESFNPFKGVEIQNLRVRSFKNIEENIPDLLIKEKITTLLIHNGFTYMKKVLNGQRNASRDLKKYLILREPIKLGELYHEHIRDYLGIEEDI